MSVTTERLNVRGIDVTVHRAGRGEPLLYLHSASAEATTWTPSRWLVAVSTSVLPPPAALTISIQVGSKHSTRLAATVAQVT